jgi:subtilisin family serine protease
VGATTSADARASFSNFGHCVDLFAPGQSITSSVNTSDTASQTWSGTSMATPHVTGVAALALQANPSASPAAVTNFIVANATTNRLTSIGTGSPNLLLYSLAAGVPTEPPLPTIAVKTLTGAKVRVPNAWAARATITIRDVSTGSVVAGAVVSGSFAPGNSGQCTTSSTGSCQITSSALPKTTPSTVFTVTDVAKAGAVYDSSQNAATQVTINQAR